jgi:tetratricopeptide (TPR) repeat protein
VSTFDAHNVQALALLGRLQIQRQDYPAARKTLEQAIAVDPEYWMAHSLLADTYLKQQEYEKAREQAQLAIDKGKGAANSALIALGQASENLGRDDEALKAYKTFVKESPSSPMAAQVRIMHNELAQRVSNPAAKSVSSSPGTDALLSASEPGLFTKAWGPPSIDDVKPSVAEGVSCPYEKVIDGAGERIKQLVDDVGRFNAIEDVLHENLNELDRPTTRTVLKFNYVAAISEPRPGVFNVGEFRDQRSDAGDFPDHIATRGLPTLALIFHPDERDDFQMACEGLGEWRGQATWLVRFEQREDRPRRIQDYKIAGHSYPVSLKGRAWISADAFHIVHVESDLVSPMPEIQLLSEHMAVDYAPQIFQKKSVELWLPKSAEIYFDFRRHHYLRRHSFDHFMLFSVDSEERRNAPGASKE